VAVGGGYQKILENRNHKLFQFGRGGCSPKMVPIKFANSALDS
jgi:hypothetical protein